MCLFFRLPKLPSLPYAADHQKSFPMSTYLLFKDIRLAKRENRVKNKPNLILPRRKFHILKPHLWSLCSLDP